MLNTKITTRRMANTSRRRCVRSDHWLYFYSEGGGEWGVGREANFPEDQAAFDTTVQKFRWES